MFVSLFFFYLFLSFFLFFSYCWLVRVSILITSGARNILSQEMLRTPKAFVSFMIIRPTLKCSHWWAFVYMRMLSGHHFFMTSFCTCQQLGQRRNVIFFLSFVLCRWHRRSCLWLEEGLVNVILIFPLSINCFFYWQHQVNIHITLRIWTMPSQIFIMGILFLFFVKFWKCIREWLSI